LQELYRNSSFGVTEETQSVKCILQPCCNTHLLQSESRPPHILLAQMIRFAVGDQRRFAATRLQNWISCLENILVLARRPDQTTVLSLLFKTLLLLTYSTPLLPKLRNCKPRRNRRDVERRSRHSQSA
jgi:hypothetical protein